MSDAAVFVEPTSSEGKLGPSGVWIAVAGWAAGARRALGRAWIVSPAGVVSPEEALALAARPALEQRTPRWWREYVPEPTITAAKDLRQLVAARRFRRIPLDGPWRSADLAFVWQHHAVFHTAGLELARAMRRPFVLCVDAPQVWEAARWGVHRPGWGRWLERAGERPQLRSADVVVCVSDDVAEQVKVLGADPDRVLVAPNGVDAESFHPDTSGLPVRERYGLSERFVVGWVGSFRPFHAVAMMLEAVSALGAALPDLALLLVGDGPERPRMEQLAEGLGLDRVTFTGTVSHEHVPSHVAAMDVALVTAGHQEFHYSPLKLVEYMACARAVVAPREASVAALARDGKEALLVERGDPRGLAAAIERLHRDPDLRLALGQAARRRAVSEHSWERRIEQVRAALDLRV